MGHPPRVPVWLRWERPVIYFVTICVANREPVLANEQAFGAFKAATANLQHWTVLAAVLMPDHLHVIASPTDARDAKLGNFSAALKRWIRRELNAAWNWQPGCFDRLLRSDESLHEKRLYIEDNPVRAGLVKRAVDWPYRIGLDEFGIGKRRACPTTISVTADVCDSETLPLQMIHKMAKTFFITTAIYYTNSSPHVGHAYEMVLADVIARYHRLKGEEVFFLTGVDQHGQKVQQSAAKAGVPPADFVKEITQKWVDLGKKLDVQYDDWAETTSDRHKKVVRGILQRLFEEGEIYKDKQAGYYSVRQEQFLTDKERGPDGEFGPEWGEIEFREEENYYFKLNQHKDWLLRYLDNRADAVIPDFRQKELRNAVEKISDNRQSGSDLCISRPKSRLDWGIELPFDKDFVTYVWFDALTNYISFAGYDPTAGEADSFPYNAQPQEFLDKWPALQIIGKDILVPAHGIYWLIMLHAIGFPDDQMPQLLVHGWWNIGGAKMSKSVGNIVDPFVLADKYSVEALRYYLMSDIATGKDADFSEERLIERYNADLANSLGNLLNRTLNMAHRYRDGKLRLFEFTSSASLSVLATVDTLKTRVTTTTRMVRDTMDNGQIHDLGYNIAELATLCNWSIEDTAPWRLAKQPDEDTRDQLDAVLFTLVESLRIIAILISPVLPQAAHEIFNQLNWRMELSGKEERFSLADAEWGRLPDGHVVGKPVPLFPRIEIDEGV